MALEPYWSDDTCSLYVGDVRDVLPQLDIAPAACVTDLVLAVNAR
ncbi:hypothetical protein [Streptomyces sp.]|jgi:hypothetical protein